MTVLIFSFFHLDQYLDVFLVVENTRRQGISKPPCGKSLECLLLPVTQHNM